jgi:hypothetical protein
MSSSANSPPMRNPPHIRLNSGVDNILSMMNDPPDVPTTRPLTSNRPIRTQPSRPPLYQLRRPGESAELLLPPSRSRPRRFGDESPSPVQSPVSATSSRRTSWSSDSAGSRDSKHGPFMSPFDDSRAPSRAGSDDDHVNTQTVSEKYNILPSAGLLLFPEDVEKDDYLHNPDPNDKDRNECNIWSKRGLVNLGGLAFITLGILVLFIGYPVL